MVKQHLERQIESQTNIVCIYNCKSTNLIAEISISFQNLQELRDKTM